MRAKMPIVIESVGDQGQRVEQGFEWPDDSALKRVEKEGGRQTRMLARRSSPNQRRVLRCLLGGRTLRPGVVLGCAGLSC